jgi:hypothetical protein
VKRRAKHLFRPTSGGKNIYGPKSKQAPRPPASYKPIGPQPEFKKGPLAFKNDAERKALASGLNNPGK